MHWPRVDLRGIVLGREPGTAVGRIFRGRDVLAAFGLMLLAAETAVAAVPVYLGRTAADVATGLHPAVAAGPTYAVTVVLAVYLQAVLVAAGYRGLRGGYRSLRRRVCVETG